MIYKKMLQVYQILLNPLEVLTRLVLKTSITWAIKTGEYNLNNIYPFITAAIFKLISSLKIKCSYRESNSGCRLIRPMLYHLTIGARQYTFYNNFLKFAVSILLLYKINL